MVLHQEIKTKRTFSQSKLMINKLCTHHHRRKKAFYSEDPLDNFFIHFWFNIFFTFTPQLSNNCRFALFKIKLHRASYCNDLRIFFIRVKMI